MLLPNIFPVTCHTDHVGPGSTFVAIKGFAQDGTQYIPVALEKGATTIVMEPESNPLSDTIQKLCTEHNATLIYVPNARQALAERASSALNHPWQKLKIIGITGTKGKTTTSYLVEHILRKAGYKTALLGTIAHKILDHTQSCKGTTPESDYLQMFFAECIKQKIDYVIMEVSSHALSLDRVHGILFDAIGFTNLYPDHMDFHTNMDDYFAAKAQIFGMLKPGGTIVINGDDQWEQKAVAIAQQQKQAHVVTFGNDALPCPALFGTFNQYNIRMATLLCLSQGVDIATITQSLATFPGVKGRLELHILRNGARAFVDYAHNAASVEAVLKTLRPHTNNLIVLFGCGGNRDKGRRPGMGQVAAKLGDLVILTSDNPRMENPDDIIKDILAGIAPEHVHKVITEPDRRKAITLAAALAGKDSIIALLGKGHENYFLVQGQTLHFDDFEEIKEF